MPGVKLARGSLPEKLVPNRVRQRWLEHAGNICQPHDSVVPLTRGR